MSFFLKYFASIGIFIAIMIFLVGVWNWLRRRGDGKRN